jgi:hypothetical protein
VDSNIRASINSKTGRKAQCLTRPGEEVLTEVDELSGEWNNLERIGVVSWVEGTNRELGEKTNRPGAQREHRDASRSFAEERDSGHMSPVALQPRIMVPAWASQVVHQRGPLQPPTRSSWRAHDAQQLEA